MDDLLPKQIELLRAMTPDERFAKGLRFLQMTRRWFAAGVRARHPAWSEAEITAETRRLICDARD